MPKINIKNSNNNPLISFLKNRKIKFDSKKMEEKTERIEFFPRTNNLTSELANILQNYGNQIYHDCTLDASLSVGGVFNYLSNQYENVTSENTVLDLPLYYVENTNKQNENLSDFKVISADRVTKNHILNISNKQSSFMLRSPEKRNMLKNIYFDQFFTTDRSKSFLNEFPYYNSIALKKDSSNHFINENLRKINFCKETLESFIDPKAPLISTFTVNEEENQLTTYDLIETLNNSNASYNSENKLILSDNLKQSNFMENNFKKLLLLNKIQNKQYNKSFSQIFQSEQCEKEYVLYKVEKFLDESSIPLQTFWFHGDHLNNLYDYQIKLGDIYRYSVTAYVVIYGTSTSVSNVVQDKDNKIVCNFVSAPSYRIAIVNLDQSILKTVSNPQLAPYVKFLNESNSENKIKIYLDLKNGSALGDFQPITNSDSSIMSFVKKDENGKIRFEYFVEDGKFEVFRLTSKPSSYVDFENAKTLDVKNHISSTSVVFKDMVKPNKKYYYMFRSVNLSSVPSNPSPVYEVELIKTAAESKIKSDIVDMKPKEIKRHDRNFNSLLQITPAFDQQIFNDQSDFVSNLTTYNKKMNNLTLGTASDKVWGKKLKIRIKSKDTGKIVDFNIKFNLIKDNIK